MTSEKWKVIGIVLMGVVAVSCGETFIARAMKSAHGSGWGLVRYLVTSPYIAVGGVLMGCYFSSYLWALSKADQSFVLPLTAFSFPLGTLLARYYLQENVTPTRWFGVFVITAGVAIVGLGEKSREKATQDPQPAASSTVPQTARSLSTSEIQSAGTVLSNSGKITQP